VKRSSTFDLDLMMHVDAELEAGEDSAVVERMDEPDVRGKAAAVRELGELVRGHVELATDEAEPRLAGMWAELAKRLDNEHKNEHKGASPVRAAQPAADAGVWKAVSRWIERYRSHVLTGALSAGAVAAVAMVLRPAVPGHEGGVGMGTSAIPATFASAPPEVESLDVPNGTGTVLTMEDEDGATAIVWVTPDDAEGI
jgi:hypothetical protein